jgi:DNA polymerase-1
VAGTKQSEKLGKNDHLYLVDGSGYIFRAYHALPPLTRKSDGLPVGAVSGFCNMLVKLLNDMGAQETPTHLAVILDASGKSFRNEIYPEYKAHRPPAPEDLVPQFPLVREAVKAFDIPAIELAGFEADDLIAAYATKAADDGARVTIVSSDKDLMQLVGDNIDMVDTMKDKFIDAAGVVEKFGVGPESVIDVQALAGDSVDNVPGVPGIGIKTAAQLIEEYGDLDTLLARAGEIKQNKRRENLIEFAEQARISRELVTLKRDTPMPVGFGDMALSMPDGGKLIGFAKAMEFNTLTKGWPNGMAGRSRITPPMTRWRQMMRRRHKPLREVKRMRAIVPCRPRWARWTHKAISALAMPPRWPIGLRGLMKPALSPLIPRPMGLMRCSAIWSACRWPSRRAKRPICRWRMGPMAA